MLVDLRGAWGVDSLLYILKLAKSLTMIVVSHVLSLVYVVLC